MANRDSHNLRSVLAARGFRRLLGVRLASQLADGWFQAGLAGSVLFNPEKNAGPVAIASALAVVFLDRWSRRNVLFGANLLRAVAVLPAAVLIWHGNQGPLALVLVLLVIAVN